MLRGMQEKIMIKLIIKEKGQTISLPGKAPFRTPAEVDISNMSLQLLMSTLKTYNINSYQIISEVGGKRVAYTNKDLEKKTTKQIKKIATVKQEDDMGDRFEKLEDLIRQSIQASNSNLDLEQINNKIDRLSDQLNNIKTSKQFVVKNKEVIDDSDIDEPDTFIPQIDTGSMKITSKDHKTVKRENNVDDTADLLSQLTKKK